VSIGAALAFYFLLFKNGDWAAEAVQNPRLYGFPGVSWIWASIPLAPIGFFLNSVMEHIPLLNKLDVNPETLRRKLGMFGEVPIIGILMGLLIGIVAGSPIGSTLRLAITLGGVMVIFPKMLGVMMEGLVPFAERVQNLMKSRFKGRTLYIGLDGAIGAGYVPLMVTTMLIVPLTPLLAVVLPGNTTLPMVDLSVAWIWGMWGAAPARGNIVRGFIIHLLMTTMVLYFAGWLAPYTTAAAKLAGADIPDGVMWTSPVMASTVWPVFFLIAYLLATGAPDIFGYPPLVMLAFATLFLLTYLYMWWAVRKEPGRLMAAAQSPSPRGMQRDRNT
jgi:PTS system galactitol-specific IIC component